MGKSLLRMLQNLSTFANSVLETGQSTTADEEYEVRTTFDSRKYAMDGSDRGCQ